MSDLDTFLAEESGSDPTQAELDAALTPEPAEPGVPTTAEQVATPEGDQGPEAPPAGLDKRGEAIWREERTRRKELQAQVDKMNERWAQMIERMQQGQPQPQQQAPESKPDQEIEIPDFEDDPIGHLRAKNALMEKQLAEVNQERQMSRAQTQQVQQFEKMREGVDQMETQFATANPDYNEAVGYLYDNVAKMATAMGYPPAQVKQVISQTAMDISFRALQAGKNPAEAAYQAAKAMGWTGPKPAEGAGEDPQQHRQPPTSLSNVAGKRTSAGNPSWDAISDMDDAEFDAFWGKMAKDARKG